MIYQQIDSKIDIPVLEKEVLKFWSDVQANKKRNSMRQVGHRWSFIDGPITANNPMGVHHAWGRTYKDLWARYWFMRGRKVRYQNGFDCQGLWVEVEVEKDLGFKSKRDIEDYGIAAFVTRCKQRVLNYAAIQTEQSIRLGMWSEWDDPEELRKLGKSLDKPSELISYNSPRGVIKDSPEKIVGKLGGHELGGSYYTLSDENNYMIWTALKSCFDRGWIYKGMDSMPWCPRCSTGISQHEIVTEGYREITHPSVYVKFPLKERKGSLLIWTTTPWTLTSNVAVAAHPELVYIKIEYKDEIFYLSKGTIEQVFQKGSYNTLCEVKGSEMEGWTYKGPYDEMETPKKMGVPESHRVIMWEEVGENEGTGLVHIAPGAGKEDLELGKIYDLPAVAPLDEYGIIVEGFGWLSGTHVYETPDPIFEDLKNKNLLLRVQDVTHRYPVCWRCGNELVFRFVSEWFINMGEKIDRPLEKLTEEEKTNNLRYQIMESAKQVTWVPEFGLKRELDWLKNMDDWMISKKRYWGLALPIWTCNCGWFHVIGSKEELKQLAVEGWEEFQGHSPHRPHIDEIKIKCNKCGGIATRIPEVGNPWLDAGIVAFSTLQYRENKKYWSEWFPADFITESFPGQFRNWFYSMLAMSTILEKTTPFEFCLGHGMVLAEDGQEMHKSWGNAIWFDEAADNMGADVMRWIYCSTKPEANVLFGFNKGNEVKRQFFMTLLNIYNFFVIYANIDKWNPSNEKLCEYSTMDKWVLSRLNMLIKEVTQSLESYDAYSATQEISKFVDILSKWYIRRSRRRFWKTEADEDKHAAYSTLYRCIKNLILLLAPFIPFTTEAMYQKMIKPVEEENPTSIHHDSWPIPDENMINKKLVDDMELAVQISSLGRSIRNRSGIKLRQPLDDVIIVSDENVIDSLQLVTEIVKDELNVKQLTVSIERKKLERLISKPIPSKLGRKHGRKYTQLAEKITNLEEPLVEKLSLGEPLEIIVNGETIEILPDEVQIEKTGRENYSIEEDSEVLVGIKTIITEDLASEGLARDIVRRIQALRKEAEYEIDDKITTYYLGDKKAEDVFNEEAEYISNETLSINLLNQPPPEESYVKEYDIDDAKIKIGISRNSE